MLNILLHRFLRTSVFILDVTQLFVWQPTICFKLLKRETERKELRKHCLTNKSSVPRWEQWTNDKLPRRQSSLLAHKEECLLRGGLLLKVFFSFTWDKIGTCDWCSKLKPIHRVLSLFGFSFSTFQLNWSLQACHGVIFFRRVLNKVMPHFSCLPYLTSHPFLSQNWVRIVF